MVALPKHTSQYTSSQQVWLQRPTSIRLSGIHSQCTRSKHPGSGATSRAPVCGAGLLVGLSVGDINLLSKGYSEVAEQSLSPQRSSRGPSAAPSPAPEGAAIAAADAETVAQLQGQTAEEPLAGACPCQ